MAKSQKFTYTYNDKDYIIKISSSNGTTTTFEYDEYGNIIYENNNFYKNKYINEYNKNKKLIRTLTQEGTEFLNFYDDNGIIIYKKDPSSYHKEEWYSYTFFEDGKTIKSKTTYFKY